MTKLVTHSQFTEVRPKSTPTIQLNHLRSHTLSLLGVAMVLVSAITRPLWLQLFNTPLEEPPFLNPTNLLMIGGLVILTSIPLRTAWAGRDRAANWRVVLSAGLTLTVLLSAFGFVNPLTTLAGAEQGQANSAAVNQMLIFSGIVGISLHSLLTTGIVFLLLRRWLLPFGTVTLIVLISTAVLSSFTGTFVFVPLFIFAGAVGDTLLYQWQHNRLSNAHLYQLGAAVPLTMFALYFGLLYASNILWWSIPLTISAIGLAGFCGLMLAVVVFPPAAGGGR